MLKEGIAGTESGSGVATEAAAEQAVDARTQKKFDRLKNILRRMGSVLVAFSGGVDSTFLLKAAHDSLGTRAVAITATSPTYPEREFEESKRLASLIGARQIVVESNELEIENFSDNTKDRCYHCKHELFEIAVERAGLLGFSCVADGSNMDDLDDFRPGAVAARELGVRSPLQEAALNKEEIRALSRALGLATWNKPAFACLSSRFPYGTEITEERLRRIGSAEDLLRGLGFSQFRVRYHGDIARIEVAPGEIGRFFEEGLRKRALAGMKHLGFVYVTLDLEGYRTGSMNEVLGGGHSGG